MTPSFQPPAEDQVLLLSRRLPVAPDPLSLFAALTEGGRAPDTVLLESAETGPHHGERSILVTRSGLRLTCRGRVVEIEAHATLAPALPRLARLLEPRCVRVDLAETRLRATFAPPPADADERTRLQAPSPLDVPRLVSTAWKPVTRPAPRTLLLPGVLAYDLLDVFETLPAPQADPTGYPDFVFFLPLETVVIDHRALTATLVAPIFGGASDHAYGDALASLARMEEACRAPGVEKPPARPATPPAAPALPPSVDLDDDAYAALVERLKGHIRAGDVFQIVASRAFAAPCPDPMAAYARLRSLNPSPCMFYVRRADDTLFGASPETCLRVSKASAGADGRSAAGQQAHTRVEIRPIAGTRPRGRRNGEADADTDSRLEAELRLDEKEVAEHMMLVDLARNDVARVSLPGTRQVDRLLDVERYSHVMHLVSHVSGHLRPDLDALHAYAACMNMGTLVGAPKLKAAEILRRVEASRRGPYGGAVGYLTWEGEMDTAIVIRAALVRDGVASVRAGAGIVHDSQPRSEADETRRKAAAVLRAIEEAAQVDSHDNDHPCPSATATEVRP